MITRTVTIVSQHINREFYLLLGKFELSRSVMVILVNQQINRNLRALPNFSSDCFTFQSTYQRGISLALGEIWAFFSVSDGHFGKSTDQQESAHHTLFSGFLVSDTETRQSTDQRGNDAHTGKNLSFNSSAVMVRMGNQRINGFPRTIPYYFLDSRYCQSTYQQRILLALRKIWASFLISIGQDGKSTDQQEYERYA
jgi:hypothetical protein